MTVAELPAAGETNRWLVLVIVCLAQFMVVLDATVVNVALPPIQAELCFSAANLQWVINGYTLVFGGFLLLGGRAGDLFGRRRSSLSRRAVDHHDDVRRGRGPHQGARRLERDRRRRRCVRAARRHPPRPPELGVDLLRSTCRSGSLPRS